MIDWDGYPQEPGRPGWHWITGNYGGADMQAAFWRAEYRDWQLAGRGYATEAEGMRGWRYVGPCVPPAVSSRSGGREENNEGDRLDDSGIYSDGSEGKA